MKSVRFTLTVICLLATSALSAEDIFSSNKMVKDKELVKTTETDFRWFFIKVYRGALFTAPDADLTDILNPRYAKELEFEYYMSISAEDFIKSGNSFLKKNITEEQLSTIQEDLFKINNAYQTVEEGDRYRLSYLPNKGTKLFLNDNELVHLTTPEFAQYYFRIWLGQSPVKDSFRDTLLKQ